MTQGATSPKAPAWRRIIAYLLDCLLIDVYLLVISAIAWAIGSMGVTVWPEDRSPVAGQLIVVIVLTWPAMFYLALAEASPWQATVGKRLLGLRVQTADGRRPGLNRTLLRAFLKLFVPWELAHFVVHHAGERVEVDVSAGMSLSEAMQRVQFTPVEQLVLLAASAIMAAYVLTLFTPTGRTVYDRIAGTRVVPSSS
jgi:uncharacterized RDD family membrane protein YckC